MPWWIAEEMPKRNDWKCVHIANPSTCIPPPQARTQVTPLSQLDGHAVNQVDMLAWASPWASQCPRCDVLLDGVAHAAIIHHLDSDVGRYTPTQNAIV